MPLTIFTVTTAMDVVDSNDGLTSLREAIVGANTAGGLNEIHFNISGSATIHVTSPLPTATGPVSILGNTQPGYSGTPLVELNGAAAGATTDGLKFTGSGNTVRGLAINRFGGNGLHFSLSSNNLVAGNYIGTDTAGTADLGNGREGVFVDGGSGNVIGGTTVADRNIISGNNFGGIFVNASSSVQIKGNYIGVSADGTADLGNTRDGIVLLDSDSAMIGGTNAAARNVISGNRDNGVVLFGPATTNSMVQGNYIGTNAAGTEPLGNWIAGVLITGIQGGGGAASFNTIGGTAPGAGNVISANTRNGVELFGGVHHNKIQGNFVGTTADGMSPLGNGGDGSDPSGGFGITVFASPDNTIGGDDDDDGTADGVTAARNVISGNALGGVWLEGAGTTRTAVAGNLIGLDAPGTAAIGNGGFGVLVHGVADNTIGGTTQGSGNTIGGNQMGVALALGATGNKLWGNRIGTDAVGLTTVGNLGDGVIIFESPNNQIGEVAVAPGSGKGNVISGNGSNGIYIEGSGATGNQILGNIIGLDVGGTIELPNSGSGVFIRDASANLVGAEGLFVIDDQQAFGRNIISGNYGSGITIQGTASSGNRIIDNRIGTDLAGIVALSNSGSGVFLDGAPQNVVEQGNVISGNDSNGVHIVGPDAQSNRVLGNIIGLDAAQLFKLPNQQDGVFIDDAPNNEIGGAAVMPGQGLGNVISGNGARGVVVVGANATGNRIRGNLIGAGREGLSVVDRGNDQHGVYVADASHNQIGGANPGEANVIAYNGAALNLFGHGVEIASGEGNAIRRNSIYRNHGLGIDLNDNYFSANDPLDTDTGGNHLQNFPIVRSVRSIDFAAQNEIVFELYSAPSSTYTWEFYSNFEPDPSGFGEGRNFLVDHVSTTDAAGFSSVTITTEATDLYISATVTDESGNTSEFSMVDTDADGLADAWEMFGINVNADVDSGGEPVIDLILPGANPRRKDLYVEIDAMELVVPQTAALDDVVQAFANAPADLVNNPDGSTGIALHYTLDETDLFTDPWFDLDDTGWPVGFDTEKNGDPNGDYRDGRYGTPDERVSSNWANIRTARLLSHRYAIFAWSYGTQGSGGRVETGLLGNDFLVTLGNWQVTGGTREQQASTFMHELGHLLGLEHGGADEINYKPNYFSVMNYTWSMPKTGYESSWRLDYSRTRTPSINELNIDETVGFGGTEGLFVPVGPIFNSTTTMEQKAKIVPQKGPIDLDGGGPTNQHVIRDLNFLTDTDGDGTVNVLDGSFGQNLHGHSDWENLRFSFNTALTNYRDALPFDDFLRLDSIGNGPGVLQFSNQVFLTNESGASATIQVARAGGTDGPVSVAYRTLAGGSATASSDYTPTTGTLGFADGEHLKSFTIPITDDPHAEGTETVLLELFNPTGTTLGDLATATLQINEPMLVRFANAPQISATESTGFAEVTVVLDGETNQTLDRDVVVYVSDLLTGSGIPDVDYLPPAGASLLFPAGSAVGATQTFFLEIIDNFVINPTRTVDLALRQVDSFDAVADTSTITVNIVEDESSLRLVKDILPGPGSAGPSNLVGLGTTLYFAAQDASGVTQLWKSSGTETSTESIGDFPGGIGELTASGEQLFFYTWTPTFDQQQLWVSDGTSAGTQAIRLFDGITSLADVGGTLYLGANGGSGSGYELWKSDGTPSGTMLVKDIDPGPDSSFPRELVDVNGTLYFVASNFQNPNNGNTNHELWKSDGTEENTVLVKDIRPGDPGSFPMELTAVGDKVFFSANDGTRGRELWVSNGSAAGTYLVRELQPGTGYSEVTSLTESSGRLFFRGASAVGGTDLWTSDGSTVGTFELANVTPYALTDVGGTLYFAVSTSFFSNRLWTSDGTVAGTQPASSTFAQIGFQPMGTLGTTAYFTADDGSSGFELWKRETTATEAELVANIARDRNSPFPQHSYPQQFVTVGENLFFTADDLIHGRELFVILSESALLPADFNENGKVDQTDYTIWKSAWGQTVAPFTNGDGNGDGRVDLADYTIWRDNLGAVPGPAGAASLASNQAFDAPSSAAIEAAPAGEANAPPRHAERQHALIGPIRLQRAGIALESQTPPPPERLPTAAAIDDTIAAEPIAVRPTSMADSFPIPSLPRPMIAANNERQTFRIPPAHGPDSSVLPQASLQHEQQSRLSLAARDNALQAWTREWDRQDMIPRRVQQSRRAASTVDDPEVNQSGIEQVFDSVRGAGHFTQL